MALKNNYEGELESIEDGYYYVCEGNQTTQTMAVADLERPAQAEQVRQLLPDVVEIVYSDPPWDPGNRKYWRTHADAEHDGDYDRFLDAWCGIIGECIEERGTRFVCSEQSNDDDNRQLMLDAVERTSTWTLPLKGEYTVYYGSPGSRSRQRPNKLLYFGEEELATDPSGLDGEPMTIRACAGLDVEPGSTVFDPCMGKGMTSRMALYYQWDCFGTEINPKRLGKTLTWLERKDFEVTEHQL
ncbi:hypothetical protein [Halocatena halophila]|uniref:hypothetical protein n=1 Tax=Halocatena halophila TaxID=2814576 RepID=UPI002ED6A811